jgi:hypothetical protein
MYGSEEEIREQQYQYQNQNQYQYRDLNDIDPFDLFETIFTGGNFNYGNRRRNNRDRNRNNEDNNRNNNNPIAKLIHYFPIIIIIVFWIFPLIFQSVILFFIIFKYFFNLFYFYFFFSFFIFFRKFLFYLHYFNTRNHCINLIEMKYTIKKLKVVTIKLNIMLVINLLNIIKLKMILVM